jgi:uncharacterized membrane protein
LAILLAAEMVTWSRQSQTITPWMAQGIVSALWAAQAFGMVWIGLMTQERIRRYAGLALFGLTVGKVIFIDTSSLETVYRIVAWLGTGAGLLAASYFYHAYMQAEQESQRQTTENTEAES